jgi:hypothetical protein
MNETRRKKWILSLLDSSFPVDFASRQIAHR